MVIKIRLSQSFHAADKVYAVFFVIYAFIYQKGKILSCCQALNTHDDDYKDQRY
jgi:hypothetical protein